MIIKAKGTVTLPKRPHGVGDMPRFCREALTCLQQLRDRAIEVPASRSRNTDTLPPFTLGRDEDGATIRYGTLMVSSSLIGFEQRALFIDPTTYYLNCFEYASAIPGVTTVIPDGMVPGTTSSLGAWGDVFLYWECDELGVITLCEIRGPDEPDSFPIPMVGNDLIRGFTGPAKYWVLIGTVPEPSEDPEIPTDPIIQIINSDVTWAVTIPQTPSSF